MIQDIRLYICGKEIDLEENFSIPMTYSSEEAKNPTIVKNSFSKTLNLKGTANNNRIFGNLWNVSALTGTGLYSFNPNKKNPFEIYINGEITQQGYCKLNSIETKGKNISYNITLFGGLGDFFYNLSTLPTGEKMMLCDLDFGGGDKEMDMKVNAKNIYDAWDYLRIMDQFEDNTVKYDLINFMTAYDGVPENFDTNTSLIRVKDLPFPDSEAVPDTPSDINGYIFAKFEFDETTTMDEVRDYRSYLQRPVLRVKRLIEAICDPKNNGGYSVNLDPAFFNKENPYYQRTWITLPKLTELPVQKVEGQTYNISFNNSSFVNGLYRIPISVPEMPNYSKGKISIPVKLNATYNRSDYDYLTTDISVYQDNRLQKYFSSYFIQLYVYNSEGKATYASEIFECHSLYSTRKEDLGFVPEVEMPITEVLGKFISNHNGSYTFDKDLNLEINNAVIESGGRMEIHITRKYKVIGTTDDFYADTMFMPTDSLGNTSDYIHNLQVSAPVTIKQTTDKEGKDPYFVLTGYDRNSITKQTILSTEGTPLDYLLGYTKQFGLYFYKNENEKTINILLRDNYYDGGIMDISDRIDYSRPYKIYPSSFDTKWVDFELKGESSTILDKYNKNYGVTFGTQRVDTNYVFNSSVKNLLKDNKYKTACMMRKKGAAYTNEDVWWRYSMQFLRITPDGRLDTLWPDESSHGTSSSYIYDPDTNPMYPIYEGWYDKMILCDFEKDNKPIDGSNVLVFFDNLITTKDPQGRPYYARLSDDHPYMEKYLRKPCWLFDMENTVEIRWMPQFIRYDIWDKTIKNSLNMGIPQETYMYDIAHSTNSNIYNKYWKDYINDHYLLDTKIVECYVNFQEHNVNECLRKIFFFDGCYWLLMKIEDYDICKLSTTKCKFVKINKIDNYIK